MPTLLRQPTETRECAFCHHVFLLTETGKQHRDQRRFCSRTCGSRWNATQKRGIGIRTFWEKVQRCHHEWLCPYCCWPWTGCIDNGYGIVNLGSKNIGTHRLVWELLNDRPFPAKKFAAHFCHNRACCNPMHIHVATPKENAEDSVRDRRHIFGERHYASKLTDSDVQEAFRLRKVGRTLQSLADQYHVNIAAMKAILRRKTHKYVIIDV